MALKHILGSVPVIKMLDHLLDNDGIDYTKDEIQNYAEVRHVDMKDAFPCLVECGVIVETRKIRGASLYKLDHGNHVTQALIIFNAALADTPTKDNGTPAQTQAVGDTVFLNGESPDTTEEEP